MYDKNVEEVLFTNKINENPMYRDEPMRAPKLPTDEQNKAIAVLHETVAKLQDRLSPILTPDYHADGPSQTNEKEPESSPLSELLKTNNRSLYAAIGQLNNLIERIDL